MSLEVGEIRSRAEEFESRLRSEVVQARAGLKTRPAFSDLYAARPGLGSRDLLADVERAMAGAGPGEERRLRGLLEWVAGHQVERGKATLLDEYFAWEATTTVEVDDREIPLRQLARVVAGEEDPVRRHELQGHAEEVLEDSFSLRLDLLERERDAVRDLGYGGYLEARERFGRMSYRPVLERGRRAVEATDAAYRTRFRGYLGRLGVDPETATRGDEMALLSRPFPDSDGEVPGLAAVDDLLRRDLSALDLPLRDGDRVHLDVEQRPLKRPESFCAAPEVPGRVVGVVAGFGGWLDARDYLGVTGTALSLDHVDPGLQFEDRYLGDPSMGHAWACLFRDLLSRPEWLGRLEMTDGRRDALCGLAAWAELLELRRDVAQLAFELELWDEREPRQIVDGYAARMEEATGFRPPPQAFLDIVGGGLKVARRLRGRFLAARLGSELDERFGEDWYRNPSAGPWLAELLAGGWRAARNRVREGTEDDGAETLVRRFRGRLEGAP